MSRRKVLVTGAASGMGRAVIHDLVARGDEVIALDADAAALDRLREGLPESAVATVAVDVRDPAAVGEAIGAVDGLDALVACAGLHDHAPLATSDPDRWAQVLDVNVLGVANCIRAALPELLRRDRADIVVWGSVSGLVAYVEESLYAASKAAVTHLVKCLRLELADTDVRVALVHPGLVDTPMTRAAGFEGPVSDGIELLQPEDVAQCVLFILDLPARANISEIVVRPTRQPM